VHEESMKLDGRTEIQQPLQMFFFTQFFFSKEKTSKACHEENTKTAFFEVAATVPKPLSCKQA